MNTPKISVVVPSFNQALYLEETLRSILDQNYPNLELIVMDGGSTDGSADIIRRYSSQITYWVSEPDGGQTDALIRGFQRSTGDIQCWLNSDDSFEPGSLAAAADYFSSHPEMDAVYGNAKWVDRYGVILREQREIPFNRFIWMYTYNYIPGMSMFWRKSVYDKVGGLRAEFDLTMDADLWIRIASVGRIGHVNEFWSRMRFYPEQKNYRLRAASDAEDLVIRSRYWKNGKPSFYRTKKMLASAMRILWRLALGNYSLNYRRYLTPVADKNSNIDGGK